ncbi:MAG: alanine--tRNA ligase [Candidatus Niyogibacteria bacterium]|nr:alanine--tRNA ligase [Candidatus Niyogibacteria bacterium]
MDSDTLRKKFLEFFANREHQHTIVPSSSLIPDDPSVLLTTAGMQQFKPYFMGKADPMRDFGSKNTVSVQKSFRTSDIDEVGDESHLTFFEMLGNFSFGYKPGEPVSSTGGYFKKEAIGYGYDFIVKELGLRIDYVSVFEGDKEVPADTESEKIWKSLGIADVRRMGREDNFWGPTGIEGPCGPTTEIYVKSSEGKSIEIWNIVFNEFYCNSDKTSRKLEIPGVDTGMGLERLAMVVENVPTIFDTDLFSPLMAMMPYDMDIRRKRVFADHARGIVFLVSDGVRPSNKEAGYVLRRLLRRIIVYGEEGIDIKKAFKKILSLYCGFYPELNANAVDEVLNGEYQTFSRTLKRGMKELGEGSALDAKSAFRLYESYGLPYEIIKEAGGRRADNLRREDFDKEFERHRAVSRKGKEKKFGGHGLILHTGELKAANEEEVKKVTRLHTATHVLQASLRKVLGGEVRQAGSDITAQRTRFDFTFPRKITKEELRKVEDMANSVVERGFDVIMKEMAYEDAIRNGALAFFKEKYPDRVSVYSVVDENGEVFSQELCGGPHVKNTEEIGHITIVKEESSAAGIRRIRATVTP